MKFGIVGPGALGTFFAGKLGVKNDVILVGKRDFPLSEVTITGRTDLTTKIDYTNDKSKLTNLDCIILCTKSYDTQKAIMEIRKHLNGDEYILSLQNGLKNEQVISKYVDKKRIIGGITGHGITFLDLGKVHHAGKGKTIIGSFYGENGVMENNIASSFKDSNIEIEITDNIYGHIWKKVIINSGINLLTALTGLKNGKLLENEYLHELMVNICAEGKEVANHEVELPENDPIKETEHTARLTSDNKSSMLQDIEKERKTEIDCITEAIIEKGEQLGIKTPYNKTIYSLIKGKERSYLSD